MGLEMCLDGRVGGMQLQFHDGLEGGNLRAGGRGQNPRLQRSEFREEDGASKTHRRLSPGCICQDVDRRGEDLLFREEHFDTTLVRGKLPEAQKSV